MIRLSISSIISVTGAFGGRAAQTNMLMNRLRRLASLLPSTLSESLIWSLPCVTISVVLQVVEIIRVSVSVWWGDCCSAALVYSPVLPVGVADSCPSSRAAPHDVHTTHTYQLLVCESWTERAPPSNMIPGASPGPGAAEGSEMPNVQLWRVAAMLLQPRPAVWHLLSAGYELIMGEIQVGKHERWCKDQKIHLCSCLFAFCHQGSFTKHNKCWKSGKICNSNKCICNVVSIKVKTWKFK